MSVLTCKMCGGDLNPAKGMTTAKCPYCGTLQTIPRLDTDRRIQLYERANHFRRRNDYDMAMALYEQILNEDQTDSEAYWSLVLCRYGIEYVEDPTTHRRIPTVNRTQFTPILADEDYKAALRYADAVQVRLYEQEAAQINAIQQGILQVSQKEAPYDIFICYKESDDRGARTKDSVLADEVYYHLSRNGYRVFFSRITLQDKLGQAYEPYIFSALHSAKIMIVIGTDPQNFQAAWVKNEWSRYLALIQKGEAKVLIPAYRDMDAYDLPKEFSNLQALNMAQLGFMQDLLHGIEKIIRNTKNMSAPPQNGNMQPIPPVQTEFLYPTAKPVKEYKPGWGPFEWKRTVACSAALIAAVLLLNGRDIYQRMKMNQEEKAAKTAQPQIEEDLEESTGNAADRLHVMKEGESEEKPALAGILAEFVSRVYQIPAKDVAESQLAKIQQLVIRRNFDVWQIGYSFDAPEPPVFSFTDPDELFENPSDGLTWIEFSSESALTLDGLSRFSGLKKLDVCDNLSAECIKGLPLESVSAYFDNPAQASSILENPGDIKELGFNGGVDNLEGIKDFENLETLYLDSSELENIDALVNLKHLKNLTLCCDETLTDFAVLEKLSELETLRLDAYGLKSIDFTKHLTNLKRLEITYCQIQALYGLENCAELEALSVTGCEFLKNLGSLESLTGLRELVLDMPYGCPEPDLGKLTALKKLSLFYAADCSFIENLTELTELHLEGCELPGGFNAAKLDSLQVLSVTSNNYDADFSAIENFPSLERIDLQGATTYKDISGIFNLPHLRELHLNDIECEIDFDAVTPNASMEVLSMNNVTLYKNIQIERDGGYMGINYDDVELGEHLDFFCQFPSLKELSLHGNKLTDLSFAKDLPRLEILDISDNYITGLSPLTGLPSLKKVICGDNPIESTAGLGDSVLVIWQSQTER